MGVLRCALAAGALSLLALAPQCSSRDHRDPPASCGDERTPVTPNRQAIVEGRDSFDPEVVALRPGQVLAIGALLQQFPDDGWRNYCTGTLVAPRLVVTAAHCLYSDPDGGVRLEPHQIHFALGQDALASTGLLVPIETHHPEAYDHANALSSHDVGVLLLEQPTTAEHRRVEPIPLTCEQLQPDEFVGQQTQHAGFGQTDPYDWDPWNSTLHWTVEVVTNLFADEFVVWGRQETGVCWGDSGSPALWTTTDATVRTIGVHARADYSCTEHADFSLLNAHCEFLKQFLEPCGEVTLSGRCQGDVAEFCQGQTLQQVHCPSWGQQCALNPQGWSRCEEACPDESWQGRCQGTVALWCQDGRVEQQDCATQGLLCASDAVGVTRCRDDPCQGIGPTGSCQAEVAQWCDGTTLRQRDCGACGQSCGWSAEHEGFYCID